MSRLILAILFILAGMPLFAQKLHKVTAQYTYYAPESMSIEEAKRTALDRAKIQAIADEFGQTVSQTATTFVANENGESNTQFYSLGGSDIKGEWVETIDNPVYKILYNDNILVVSVIVKGTVREIRASKIDFIAKPLRNGTDLRFESTDFRDGDDLYLYFKSPVDGWLLAYLIDYTASEAFCLLPYSNSFDSAVKISSDRDYIFFKAGYEGVGENQTVDEYTLNAQKNVEINDLDVFFSTDEIQKSIIEKESDNLPGHLPLKEYLQWSSNLRNSSAVNYQKYSLSIKNE